jgi:hypothetical protein
MVPPLEPLTCTTSALLLSEAKLIDHPAAIAVVDGKVTVRLDVGVLKLEMTDPQSLGPAAKLLTAGKFHLAVQVPPVTPIVAALAGVSCRTRKFEPSNCSTAIS